MKRIKNKTITTVETYNLDVEEIELMLTSNIRIPRISKDSKIKVEWNGHLDGCTIKVITTKVIK